MTEKKKRSAVIIVFWVVLAILLAWLLLWFFHFRWRVYTDDAYVAGNRILIKPQVSGSITAYYADDNDYVNEGNLLVTLDKSPFHLELNYQKQNLALAVRNARTLKEAVGQRRAELALREAELQKAQDDFDNRQAVIASLAVSGEDLEHATASLNGAKASVEAAEKALGSAIAAYGNDPVEQHPSVLAQKETVRRAYLNLRYCNIFSPVSGYVAKRAAQVGDWALPTSTLMSVVPYDQMWIEANYKETQLKYVKVGQPVEVRVDLYGSSVDFKGHVQGISSGSGSVFSLIPPQNATGNWIKIVQRLPVKILLDPEQVRQYPLRLGLSTETWISLRDTEGASIRAPAPLQQVEGTWVYDIDMDSINLEMEQIIQANLKEEQDNKKKKDTMGRIRNSLHSSKNAAEHLFCIFLPQRTRRNFAREMSPWRSFSVFSVVKKTM